MSRAILQKVLTESMLAGARLAAQHKETSPMNPHQKPQEDVVVTQEDKDAAHLLAGKLHSLCGVLLVGDGVGSAFYDAFARHRLLGHEAGRRDMREAAGKVAQDEAGDIERHHPSSRDSWHQGRAAMAKSIAASIRALPTEPLGGEGPRDNSGPE